MELLQLDNSIMVLRVLLAVALGAALGLEREIDSQPAGFRRLRLWVRHRFGRRTETVTFRLATGVEPAGVVSALNGLAGVNVRNLQVDSSGEAAEVTVGLKTETRVPLERMLGELAARDDVDEMAYDDG